MPNSPTIAHSGGEGESSRPMLFPPAPATVAEIDAHLSKLRREVLAGYMRDALSFQHEREKCMRAARALQRSKKYRGAGRESWADLMRHHLRWARRYNSDLIRQMRRFREVCIQWEI